VNASPVGGATNSTFVYVPDNGDSISCEMTSNAACATPNPVTSNSIVMTMTPLVLPGITLTGVPD
ncbi:MAG: hypothetical protein FWH39_03340, partial [Bacteroidales bacterium]|nr:hypothetical protein [Bacteroidales bacterium]